MYIEFASRMIGMVIFALVGARLGVSAAPILGMPQLGVSVIFSLVGILFGLIMTPWITIRPLRILRRFVNEMPVDALFTTLLGLLIGLLVGLLAAYPLSLLDAPFGTFLPAVVLVLSAYLFTTIFNVRSREVWLFLSEWFGIGMKRHLLGAGTERQLILDTSVLIDGRIVDIAKTGFLGGTLVVPRFVISELHRVADSSDAQRRNRGRRGLTKLNELQRESGVAFKIIEEDIEEVPEVDDKLIALALRMNSPVVTIDYPMNQVAAAQGATVLNINALANAVRSAYIPGETFALRIIQDGKEAGQGVGYLEDGTMVIVENGKDYMDRTLYVEVTKLINRETGRIIFAKPADSKS
ncbi:MAG TPA: PIN domain-containing protein [Terriglobales bacterium]|nr:PIN domain-containing protein [Terriglobales bacterium]